MNLLVRGVGEPVMLLLFVVLAYFVSPTAGGLALAHLVAAVLTSSAAAWAFMRVFGAHRLRSALRAPRHPALLRYALPLSAAELCNLVLQRADLAIVLYYLGEEAAGIYAGAEFFSRAVGNARYAFDYVACPVLAEAHEERNRARLAYNLGLMTRWV